MKFKEVLVGVSSSKLSSLLSALYALKDESINSKIAFILSGSRYGYLNLAKFIERVDLSNLKVVLHPEPTQCFKNYVNVFLGFKGMAYVRIKIDFKMRVTSFNSRFKTHIVSPTWYLIYILKYLTSKIGEDLQPESLYKEVKPPDETDIRLLGEILKSGYISEFQKFYDDLIPFDLENGDLLVKMLFTPYINISKIMVESAINGVPTVVSADLEYGLICDMDPLDITSELNNYISNLGFKDIKIELLSGFKPIKYDFKNRFISLIINLIEKYNGRPLIWPISPYPYPASLFKNATYIPFGLCYGGFYGVCGEFIVINHYHSDNSILTLRDLIIGYRDFFRIISRA